MTELFTLLGKVAVDTQEANESLDDTVDKAEKSEGKLSSIGEKIGNGLQKLAKAGAVVLAATATVAATALVSLSTKAVQCYADYEQLVGGVETLFGAGGQSIEEYADSVGKSVDDVSAEYNNLMKAQDAVLDHANKAYETAGLSANAYMETVTSFSAALISSLDGDTVKAAEVADKAIVDMSDNANKMGSSMESIQNAYQGFAKQNYTMLDNLKLGYGGTKEEMQRLLDDAGKLANQKFDLSSYADIVEAIHVVQENMGIAGTTAKEAATTIQGSIGMMKASWTNFVTGLADENADAQYLKEMRNMTRKVKGESVKLRQMKEELFCIGSVGFGHHIQRTKSSDPMGNRIAAYVDYENEYHKYVIEYIEKYKCLNEVIRDLDIMNQMFIINYCFFGMDYSEIAENMGVSEQTVYRIRIDTLIELERIDSNE